ncbi:MAG: hypothetical protein IKY46_00445 [Clostridia bacterium]|nr:hypothetical protein [Clostridia bacterium]MBR5903819.1 hypothetical protein [Clostridia bacterium]
MKKTLKTIAAILGIVTAIAGIAAAVYYFLKKRDCCCCGNHDECDCECDCDYECDNDYDCDCCAPENAAEEELESDI